MFESQYFDITVLAVYLSFCLCIGLYKASRVKSLRTFALGGSSLSSPILVITIFATAYGAGSTIGYTQKIFNSGTLFIVCLLFEPLFWLVTAWIFARNIERFAGCLSISEIMYRLYGLSGRWVTSISAIILSIASVAAQASAVGFVFHYFFGISLISGIFISYGVLTIYSALGGIRAVVLTEVFQITIFFLIIPISYAFTLNEVGGVEGLMHSLPLTNWGLEFSWENLPLAASLIFFSLLPNTLAPAVQRYLMASSSEALKRSLRILALITVPFVISLCIIAYIVKVHAPDINPAETFVYYIAHFMPIGLKSLMITGIIAVIMSAAEAHLNCASVIMVNDILKVLYPKVSRFNQLIALRLGVIFVSGLSIFLAIEGFDFLALILMAQNFWSPIILVPLSAGFLGFKTNSKSFIASVITALTLTFLGRYYSGIFATISISLGIIGSAVGLFGMHYWQEARKVTLTVKPQLIKHSLQWSHFVSIIKKVINKKLVALSQLIKMPLDKNLLPKMAYYPFAGFVLVYYFIYTLYLNSDPSNKVLLYLLVIGYFLCLILLLKDILFSVAAQKIYLPIYWYFTLTFCLPLVSSFMLFASHGDDFWIINGMLSAFSLYFFANYIIFITSLSIGALGGYILFILTNVGTTTSHTHGAIISIGYIYLFFLFTSLFFMRKKEKGHEDQLEIMKMVGGAIAHEVKSPIATMSMCANALTEVLDKSFETSKKEKDEVLIRLNQDEYDLLQNISKSMQRLSKKGVNTVDNILISLRTSVVANDKKLYSLKHCVKEALEEYTTHNEAAKNIEIKIHTNFKIHCSIHYFKHMLFNLLNNAYKYNGQNVKIKIWTRGRKLHFKDYGNGIDEEDLPHIFKRFYTKTETGTGIGLPFCQMVMEDLGGTIECHSQTGKFTEFILSFPALRI